VGNLGPRSDKVEDNFKVVKGVVEIIGRYMYELVKKWGGEKGWQL